MKKLILTASLFLLVLSVSCPAAEPVRVVTATRILEDWVQQVGGEQVQTESIHKGRRDIHYFEPRPSHIKKVSRADALVIAGLDADPWMPELIAASRNPSVQYGAEGLIDPSVNVYVLEKPSGKIDMRLGDVHPYGNPHFYFYKENVLKAVDNIAGGLSRIQPEMKEIFRRNAEAYKQKVRDTFGKLNQKCAPYKGTKLVTYHKSWEYFARQFGFEVVGNLEPKPGIPPSPSHLASLVDKMNAEKVKLVIAENFYPENPVRSVTSRTQAQSLRLASHLGEREEDTSYLDLLEKNVNELVEALSEK